MFRTLLVDDDFLVRSYLKTLSAWEKAGYEVVKDVQDGEEALAFWKRKRLMWSSQIYRCPSWTVLS